MSCKHVVVEQDAPEHAPLGFEVLRRQPIAERAADSAFRDRVQARWGCRCPRLANAAAMDRHAPPLARPPLDSITAPIARRHALVWMVEVSGITRIRHRADLRCRSCQSAF